jgi:NAD(P)-dependent dehydrogenase (short-subunit alcohol dehydrogenase family)
MAAFGPFLLDPGSSLAKARDVRDDDRNWLGAFLHTLLVPGKPNINSVPRQQIRFCRADGRVEEIGPVDWDRCLAVNLTGQFNCARGDTK